jgi:F0F1-type ATP synthase assembly protein I
MNDFLKYVNLGVMIVAPAAVGVFLGTWIDGMTKTYPLFTLVLLFIGILSGFWSLYKATRDMM